MSVIILPHAMGPSEEYGGRKFEPGYVPRAPLCMRCSREATYLNPIGITFRPSWNPLDRDRRKHLDAICAECREKMR